MARALWALTLLAGMTVGCQPEVRKVDSTPNSPDVPAPQDRPYCTAISSYPSGPTINGTAIYKRRQFVGSGLGATDSTDYPIRFAEIRVTDGGGNLVQCGETAADGTFSLKVPSLGAAYTVTVTSRADNSVARISVLDNPTSYNYHYVASSQTVSSDPTNFGNITATATGTITGGAFNILDQLIRANEFLVNQTANCNLSFADCPPFSPVAHKAYVYWTKGFNPASYFNISSGISFYLTGKDQLFILGGINGDTDNQDTDHFDNSVIVHEYGHFIEDNFSKTDSPGGSHDANSIIDPRLAWGEGWANFFALAVQGDPVYRDTKGNVDGSTLYLFKNDIELNSPVRDKVWDDSSPGTSSGEGTFREFAITRTLWDFLDPYTVTVTPPYSGTDSDADGVDGSFSEFWTIFAGSNGLKNSSHRFRNFGLFMSLQGALAGGTSPATILLTEEQKPAETDYAPRDTTPGGTCNHTILPINPNDGDNETNLPSEDGSFAESNMQFSNDFYEYQHGGGALAVNLTWTSGSPAADLDLYLYSQEYVYGDSSTIVAFSNQEHPADGGDEDVSVSLALGTYLINVMVYTGSGLPSQATYTLTANGEQICP